MVRHDGVDRLGPNPGASHRGAETLRAPIMSLMCPVRRWPARDGLTATAGPPTGSPEIPTTSIVAASAPSRSRAREISPATIGHDVVQWAYTTLTIAGRPPSAMPGTSRTESRPAVGSAGTGGLVGTSCTRSAAPSVERTRIITARATPRPRGLRHTPPTRRFTNASDDRRSAGERDARKTPTAGRSRILRCRACSLTESPAHDESPTSLTFVDFGAEPPRFCELGHPRPLGTRG